MGLDFTIQGGSFIPSFPLKNKTKKPANFKHFNKERLFSRLSFLELNIFYISDSIHNHTQYDFTYIFTYRKQKQFFGEDI